MNTCNCFKNVRILIVAFMLLSVVLTACAPAATPTQVTAPAVQDTQAPPAAPTATTAVAQPTDPPAPTEEPKPQFMAEKLRAAIISDEASINPFTYVTGDPGWNILMMQYDSLYILDIDGEPQPWLVTDLSSSDDGLEYTLTLRDDVTWNDGTPFTAEDVKFTFDFLTLYPVGRFARDIRGFESAEVIDTYSVVIKLSGVRPSYVRNAFADVPMIPKHIWEEVTDPQNHQFDAVTNVGTGPFMMMEYVPDQFYRFEANPNYFKGLPTVKELVLIKFADDAGAQAAFRTNEVDMIFRPIPPEQVNLLGSVQGVKIASGPQFTTQMLVFNYDVEPFNLIEVRKAVAYAIDTQDLVDTIYLGAATKGSFGWIHPSSIYYNPSVETIYNLELANQLLDSVNIVDSNGDGVREFNGAPLSFELLTPNNNALRMRMAELIKEMLGKAGFVITVSAVEQTTWEEAVWPGFDINNGRSYQMSMWGWSAPVQADTFRAPELVHSSPDVGFLNLTGVSNSEIDRICDEMNSERDLEKRVELLKELQLAIAEEMPFVIMMYPDGVYAYWATVYDNLAFIAGQGVVNKLSFLPEEARP
jgi:peptide/nickel transport system substrate-binding protein